jgi:hypothetical protein
VLEEQVALDSDKVMALRERLFGNWEMNWVGFNYARDFTLAGMKDGPIGFSDVSLRRNPRWHRRLARPDDLRLCDLVKGDRLANVQLTSLGDEASLDSRRGRIEKSIARSCKHGREQNQ